MENGNTITRRGWLAAAAGTLALPCRAQSPAILTSKNRVQTAGCVLAAEQEEGPYYLDQALIRSDITESRPGIPLRLRIAIVDGTNCKPIPNAAVNIWHCDAIGNYSGFTANSMGGPGMRAGRPPFRPDGPPPGMPPPPFHHGSTDNTRFLRGVQITDATGTAEFLTIYPGWYMGRAIHIHLKVSTNGRPVSGRYGGGHVCHTGQLFFPEDLTADIGRLQPYVDHRIERTLQAEDGVFTSEHGNDFILSPLKADKRNLSAGLFAGTVLGVNPNAEPLPARRAGPELPGPPPEI